MLAVQRKCRGGLNTFTAEFIRNNTKTQTIIITTSPESLSREFPIPDLLSANIFWHPISYINYVPSARDMLCVLDNKE